MERMKWLFDKQGTGDVRVMVESTAVRSAKVWDRFGPWGLLQAELQRSRETDVPGTQATQERRSRGSVWKTIKSISAK